MTIEIKEKGTESFYREVVSVTAQYQSLLKKPDGKYRDLFKTNRNRAIFLGILLVLMLVIGISDKFSALTITAVVVLAIALIMVFVFNNAMRKQVQRYLAESDTTVLTLDENGVEVGKEKSQTVRLAWDNVAFIRKFEESICFFSKESSRIVIAVAAKYEKEIDAYLNDNSIDVRKI